MIGEPHADSRPFMGNTTYHMKIRNKRYKVNKNKIRFKKHWTKQAVYDSLLEGYH